MKTKNLIPAFLLAAFALASCQNTEHNTTEAMADSSLEQTMTDTMAINRGEGMDVFFKKATVACKMEIEISKMATEKAGSSDVKKFAGHMVKDYTRALDELKKMAGRKNMMVPDSITQADADHITAMAKLSGDEFDKHYMDMIINDHVKILDLFKSATTYGDIEIRKYAAKTLRKIENHYKDATSLRFNMK